MPALRGGQKADLDTYPNPNPNLHQAFFCCEALPSLVRLWSHLRGSWRRTEDTCGDRRDDDGAAAGGGGEGPAHQRDEPQQRHHHRPHCGGQRRGQEMVGEAKSPLTKSPLVKSPVKPNNQQQLSMAPEFVGGHQKVQTPIYEREVGDGMWCDLLMRVSRGSALGGKRAKHNPYFTSIQRLLLDVSHFFLASFEAKKNM